MQWLVFRLWFTGMLCRINSYYCFAILIKLNLTSSTHKHHNNSAQAIKSGLVYLKYEAWNNLERLPFGFTKIINHFYQLLKSKKVIKFKTGCEIIKHFCNTVPLESLNQLDPSIFNGYRDEVVQQKLPWMEAHLYCKIQNSELTTVDSESEYNYLQIRIIGLGIRRSEYFWTSGNDIFREGRFTWLSRGEKVLQFYPNNNKNEPNGSTRENCVDLYLSTQIGQYVMADFPCDRSSYFICKMKL